MKITFLGTGTSQGVPMIGCHCEVCQSSDHRDKRLRSSIWIQTDKTSVVIDSGPDFRYQMLRERVEHLDAIVYTHGHKDHVAGLDDVRAFNYFQKESIPLFVNNQTEEVLHREFIYAFEGPAYPGIPRLELHSIQDAKRFSINELVFQPIRVMHYKLEVFGYRIGDLTYITDANYIAPEELEKIKGSKTLIISALRKEKHISHFTLSEAIEVGEKVGAEQVFITHISHQMGLHNEVSKELPENVHLGYDGLTLEI